MASLKKALGYGFLVWLIPFGVSFVIFPLKKSSPALFESVMPVVIAVCAVLFAALYLRGTEGRFLKEGVLLGVIWFAISLVLDLFMFMWGPMKMAFADYMMDIGLTYLMIPTITIGAGWLVQVRKATAIAS